MENNKREIIAKASTDYLSQIMIQSQNVLTKLVEDKTQLVPFDEFANKVRDYRKRIHLIEDCESPERRELLNELHDYELLCMGADDEPSICKVVISKEQIDELMGIVSKSILNVGLGNTAFYNRENAFLRGCCFRARDIATTPEEKNRIQDWMNFLYCDDYAGIDPELSGRISWGYRDEFRIESYSGRTIYGPLNIKAEMDRETEDMYK